MPASNNLNFKIPIELAGRIDRAVRKLGGVSHSVALGLFDNGCVSLNGNICNDASTPVRLGDVLELNFNPQQRYREKQRDWEDDAFKIIFEDRHLIVVDKASGVLTVPAHPGEKGSLINALNHYFEQRGYRERAQVVHRLDRDVSGVLVFAKSKAIAEALQSQFEERKPEREYRALVHGETLTEGTFESRLGTSKSLQRFSIRDANEDEGELAITHFRREKIIRGASWVRVWLETGRRNQIRVHFAEAGHPVLGDQRYRPDLSSHLRWRAKRLALHAAVLGFRHPVTEKEMRFEAPLPAAMKSFVDK